MTYHMLYVKSIRLSREFFIEPKTTLDTELFAKELQKQIEQWAREAPVRF